MDGVIVDSEPLHEKAFQVVFEEMGYGQTHGFHFPDYYGRSDKALWLDFIARHSPPQPFDELMAWKQFICLCIVHLNLPSRKSLNFSCFVFRP